MARKRALVPPSIESAAAQALLPRLGEKKLEPEKKSMPELMAEGQKLAGKMNAATDALNDALAAAEEQFNTLNLGVPVWVNLETDVDDEFPDVWERALGYCKHDGQWGFYMSWGHVQDPHPSITPLRQSSRRVRQLAAKSLQPLMEKLIAQANRSLKDLVDDVDDVLHFVDMARSARGEGGGE